MEWCNIISLHAIFDNKSRVQILEVFQPEDRFFAVEFKSGSSKTKDAATGSRPEVEF